MSSTQVAIIGAGPYGLSLAAYLQHAGVPYRIFGRPMETWSEQMPQGMLLKSDGFASNIVDPQGRFELQHFCSESGIAYDHTRTPVSLETFAQYGMEFQKRILPSLETTKVISLDKSGAGYNLRLEDGKTLRAEKVVIATGISYYAHLPELFSDLEAPVFLHSSAVRYPAQYVGKSVAIVGSGASAIDLAALLHEAGAIVTILSRRAALKFNAAPGDKPRTLLEQLRAPDSGVGPGWKARLVTQFPGVFRLLPLRYRLALVRRALGPAAGWPMRDRVMGKINIMTQVTPTSTAIVDGKASVTLTAGDGSQKTITADHVVCATGYKPRLQRLAFLTDALRSGIASIEDTPVLSASFESSVPGLFFIGVSAANTFGPVMRFAFGAKFAAKTVCRHLARDAKRRAEIPSAKKPTAESVPA